MQFVLYVICYIHMCIYAYICIYLYDKLIYNRQIYNKLRNEYSKRTMELWRQGYFKNNGKKFPIG